MTVPRNYIDLVISTTFKSCISVFHAIPWKIIHISSVSSCMLYMLYERFLRENSSYVTYMKPLIGEDTELTYYPSECIKIAQKLGEGAFGCVFLVQMKKGCLSKGPTVKNSEKHGAIKFKAKHRRHSCQSRQDLLFPSKKKASFSERTFLAMKLLKTVAPDKVADLKREAGFLTKLDDPNIVRFYGISLFDKQDIALLFEYMENGDLAHYLRDRNPDLMDPNTSRKVLEYHELLMISCQVASGLSYLVDNFLVHRDLAARNCLVSAGGTVKLSDFGMTRELYSTSNYYQMGSQAMIPLRWLPPESVIYRKFTTESDMWSYGVLCYEIWSYGQVPWYAYSNSEVMEILKSGRVLEKPDKCPQHIYDSLILKCFNQKPQERPTAIEAKTFFEGLLEQNMNYCIISSSPSV